MGAWGMTPFDSDDFGDTFIEFSEPIAETTYRKLEASLLKADQSREPQEMWTTIGLVIWAYHAGLLRSERARTCIDLAEALMAALGSDDDWLRSWRNPSAFKKVFAQVRDELEDEEAEEAPLLPHSLHEMFSQSTPRVPKRRKR